MIELPEALVLAKQANESISGRRIAEVTAAQTPHKLAWYYGDPSKYNDLLRGRVVGKAISYGGLVELAVEESRILFGEGANVRFHNTGEQRPSKHQLLVEFEDGSALSAAVQMYGGMGAFENGRLENPYYQVAKDKPSPYSPAFNTEYFHSIIAAPGIQKMSLKGLLATEQRIPGLGNGVLQDILFNARIHPKKKVGSLEESDKMRLFEALRSTLVMMAKQGGRDTEMDLFNQPGGYRTILSKNTVNKPCPVCGTAIKKEAYMGGSIYYCAKCQML